MIAERKSATDKATRINVMARPLKMVNSPLLSDTGIPMALPQSAKKVR
jgi:hypothetical protein